jgi:calcium-dependent protein kinase
MKVVLLTFITSQVMTNQEKEELQKTFSALDTDGNGTLSKEEMILGIIN